MALRKFIAGTIEEAFARIERELGGDAIILDTRTFLTECEPGVAPAEQVEVWVQEPDTPTARDDAPGAVAPDIVSDDLSRLHARVQAVHAQLDTLAQRLDWLGAESSALSGDFAMSVAEGLARNLTFSSVLPDAPARVALIGPSGVGKTTCLARLAYRALREGGTIGVISADTVRIGAREQIATLCEHGNIPLEIVYHPADVDGALRRLDGSALTLLDTPGINPRQPEDGAWLVELLAAFDPAQVHLVQPASVSAPALRDTLQTYARFTPDHLLISKMDEAAYLVDLLPVIARSGLALSYFGMSSAVAEAPVPAASERLAQALRLT
ncbi:MAG: Flagellar biosynthesis protein FlhF [bacterium ADurb.Bin429]|nr:MAG: Flagellar biosynthesis protein FlhF [bacterium ADurb.Bin429]